MLNLAILGSGSGSNMQAILDAIAAQTLDARITHVISDNPDAYILERAAKNKIPAQFLDCSPHKTRFPEELQSKLAENLLAQEVHLICLAGFMRLVKAPLLSAFPNRILNIHPSLLPAFPGLEAWTQALEAEVPKTGCTVHLVDDGMDTGPIISQAQVPVLPDDTATTLHQRIQIEEHRLYPEAIQIHAQSLGLL